MIPIFHPDRLSRTLVVAVIGILHLASAEVPAQSQSVTTASAVAQASALEQAQAAMSRKDHPEAIELTQNYLKEYAGDDDARLVLARAQLADGQAEAARTTAEEILKRSPNSTDALLFRGLALRRLGDREMAKADFQRVTQISPDYCDAHFALVSTHLLDKETSAANLVLSAMPTSCKQAASTGTMSAYEQLSRRVQLALDPSLACNEDWWRDRGPEPREEEDQRLREARVLLAKDDVKGAEKLVDEVLNEFEDNSDASILKARIEIRRGKDSEAEKRLEAVLLRGAAYSDCEARVLLAQARMNQRDYIDAKSSLTDCPFCLKSDDAEQLLNRIDTTTSLTSELGNVETRSAAKGNATTPSTKTGSNSKTASPPKGSRTPASTRSERQ